MITSHQTGFDVKAVECALTKHDDARVFQHPRHQPVARISGSAPRNRRVESVSPQPLSTLRRTWYLSHRDEVGEDEHRLGVGVVRDRVQATVQYRDPLSGRRVGDAVHALRSLPKVGSCCVGIPCVRSCMVDGVYVISERATSTRDVVIPVRLTCGNDYLNTISANRIAFRHCTVFRAIPVSYKASPILAFG